MLFLIGSAVNNPCCLRSSGTREIFFRIASAGELNSTRSPINLISPEISLSAPNSALANSVLPDPTIPANPTISPLWSFRFTF